MALLAILLAGLSLYLFQRLAASAWGKAMVAVRDSETAARLGRIEPGRDQDRGVLRCPRCSPAMAGAIFSPLMMFVAPDSFPFLAVDPVPAGRQSFGGLRLGCWGPAVGAAVTSDACRSCCRRLAEYRLLFCSAPCCSSCLWIAPGGHHRHSRTLSPPEPIRRVPAAKDFDLAAFSVSQQDHVTKLTVSRHRAFRSAASRAASRHPAFLLAAPRPHHQRDRTEWRRQDPPC